jgi:hypothetical protein
MECEGDADGTEDPRHNIGLVMTSRRITPGISRPATLAAVFAVAAIVVYAAMWVGYRQQWSWLHDFDWTLLNAGHALGIQHPVAVHFWDGVSYLLGPPLLRWIGVAVAVAALVQRNVRAALVLFAAQRTCHDRGKGSGQPSATVDHAGFRAFQLISVRARAGDERDLPRAVGLSVADAEPVDAPCRDRRGRTERAVGRDSQGRLECALPVRRTGRLVAWVSLFSPVSAGVSAASGFRG